jgi:hypothetical protein
VRNLVFLQKMRGRHVSVGLSQHQPPPSVSVEVGIQAYGIGEYTSEIRDLRLFNIYSEEVMRARRILSPQVRLN